MTKKEWAYVHEKCQEEYNKGKISCAVEIEALKDELRLLKNKKSDHLSKIIEANAQSSYAAMQAILALTKGYL